MRAPRGGACIRGGALVAPPFSCKREEPRGPAGRPVRARCQPPDNLTAGRACASGCSGGLEMLFGNQKKIDVSVPVDSTGPPVSMRQVLAHLKVPPRARVRLCLRAGRDVLSQAHAPVRLRGAAAPCVCASALVLPRRGLPGCVTCACGPQEAHVKERPELFMQADTVRPGVNGPGPSFAVCQLGGGCRSASPSLPLDTTPCPSPCRCPPGAGLCPGGAPGRPGCVWCAHATALLCSHMRADCAWAHRQILVLVNDADWELHGGIDYEVELRTQRGKRVARAALAACGAAARLQAGRALRGAAGATFSPSACVPPVPLSVSALARPAVQREQDGSCCSPRPCALFICERACTCRCKPRTLSASFPHCMAGRRRLACASRRKRSRGGRPAPLATLQGALKPPLHRPSGLPYTPHCLPDGCMRTTCSAAARTRAGQRGTHGPRTGDGPDFCSSLPALNGARLRGIGCAAEGDRVCCGGPTEPCSSGPHAQCGRADCGRLDVRLDVRRPMM